MSRVNFNSAARADQRDLAMHVAEIVRSALTAPPRPAGNARSVASVSLTSVGKYSSLEQLDLPWCPNHFSLRICNSGELARAVQASNASGFSNLAVKGFIADLAKKPNDRALSQPPSRQAFAALAMRFPNFTAVVDYLLRRAALAFLEPPSPLQFPPLVLDGAPGVGKTAFAKALAEVFGVPILTLQMAHATSPFMLGGLDPMYATGGPGQLAKTVALGPNVDPIVLLDELDKTPQNLSHDPLGPLYSLLEPGTAEAFIDDGLKMALNLSAIKWICTTNSLERLSPAIRSRCKVFCIAAPTLDEGKLIARQVYSSLVQKHPWGVHFALELCEPVAALLGAHTPREMTRQLEDALGVAALAGRAGLLTSDFSVPEILKRAPGFL